MSVKNFFTVDLEDWYHVWAFNEEKDVNGKGYENRVAPNTHRILDLLKLYHIKATFFVLGIIAEKNRDLIKKIHAEGHEVASHGYHHMTLNGFTPQEFREDLRATAQLLKDIVGYSPKGFRAPFFSMTEKTSWALEILAEEGYLYDASIFPAKRAHGGLTSGPYVISDIKLASGRKIKEFPTSIANIGGMRVPFSGGGYFRLLPYVITEQLFKRFNSRGIPVIFYIHPRDIDPYQPRLKMGVLKGFKCYVGLRNAEKKLSKLIENFSFGPIGDVL